MRHDAPELATRWLPYALSIRLWSGLVARHRRARTALFHEAVEQVRAAADALELDAPPTDAVDAALRRIVWDRLRVGLVGGLARSSSGQLNRWVRCEGIETLERARRGGRGVVVLNSQFGVARAVPVVLARSGYGVYALTGGDLVGRLDRSSLRRIPNLERGVMSAFPLRELQRAGAALREGRLVHAVGTGRLGTSEVTRIFCGRVRPFRLGFAALALHAAAAVAPTFATLDSRGRIRIELLDPLDTPPVEASWEERIACLVDQYARILERRWLTQPGELPKPQVQRHASYPAAPQGARERD